jgi:hypothetical protein
MKRLQLRRALGGLLIVLGLFAVDVFAQTGANPLVGTWALVSLNAGTAEPYGSNPRGAMFLAPNGHFSITILRESIPRFASNNRTTGSDAENKAVVQSSIAFYGTYSVNESAQTLDMLTVAATYPNSDGTKQSRPYTLSADELTLTTASPSGGGGPTVQVCKRVR